MRASRRVGLVAVTLAGCVRGEVARAAVLEVGPPALDLGIAEGEPQYEFAGVTGALRQSDGSLVVANATTSELRFFDSAGRHLRSRGRSGEGPGEYGGIGALLKGAEDTILVWDQRQLRLSILAPDGEFVRQVRIPPAGDGAFPLDVWLHRRNWVQGPVDSLARPAIAAALDRLADPTLPTFRFIRVDALNHLWLRDSTRADESADWRIYSLDGTLRTRATTPARFTPFEIGSNYLLGKWLDSLGVEHVRVYPLHREPMPVAPGQRQRTSPVAGPPQGAQEPGLTALREALRNVVMAQEAYYADHGTYTTRAGALRWQQPGDLTLTILAADNYGWTGAVVGAGVERICGMGVGWTTPAGWSEGTPKCD